jgi:hypothetical protein
MRWIYERPLDAAADFFPEFMLGVMTVSWGGMLLLPSDTFSVSQGYSLLATVAPEYVFGLVFLLAGLLYLHALIIANHIWQRRTAIVLLFLWSLVALAFAIAAPASAAWPLFVGLATLFGWSAARHQLHR